MGRYIAKRMLSIILIIFAAAIVGFTLMYLVPGDPAKLMLGLDAKEAVLQAKILCTGPVLLYAQSRPSEVLVNHQAADWQWADGWLRFTAEAGSLIEIIDSTPHKEEN